MSWFMSARPISRCRLGSGNIFKKLSGRKGISLDEMSFRCLFVEEDLSAVSPEKMLIKRHLQGGKIVWNNRGFGNNDPGRERDTTRNKENHWDLEFPIDISRDIGNLRPGRWALRDLLEEVKARLPFNFFRFQRNAVDVNGLTIVVPDAELSVDDVFRLISRVLPREWQIAALVGWVIMYKDRDQEYPGAFRYYRSGGTSYDQKPQTRLPRKGELAEDLEVDESSVV